MRRSETGETRGLRGVAKASLNQLVLAKDGSFKPTRRSRAGRIKRPAKELKEKLPIGDPETCAEKLSAYARAGAQRVFLWPLADELKQLEAFSEQVIPKVRQPRFPMPPRRRCGLEPGA